MVAFAFNFPAERYHATPWGRHANEADVAWPPEPARILRMLIATWWRKADHRRFPKPALDELIDTLAAEAPVFHLPPAVHSHIRAFMPAPEKKALIYDGFLRFGEETEVIVAWPGIALNEEIHELATHLLERMGYLGRAESWAEGRLAEDWDGVFNAHPRTTSEASDPDAVPVDVMIPVTAQKWGKLRTQLTSAAGKQTKKQRILMQATLPERLADALAVDTGQWQAAGWSSPPPLRKIVYDRPTVGPLPPRMAAHHQVSTGDKLPQVARFLLAGRPCPRIEDAVRIGELMRLATLAKFGRGEDGRWRAPSVVSGRGEDGQPLKDDAHSHAFWLSEDVDDDGLIDHIIVFAQSGLNDDAQKKLDRVTRLWLDKNRPDDSNGEAPQGRKEWRLALEGFGRLDDFRDSALLRPSHRWRSVTPYLMPWHAKKGFGPEQQIRRELRERGLPWDGAAVAIKVEAKDGATIRVRGRELRSVHFHRFRSRRGLTQPDKLGNVVEMHFKTAPQPGPLALGFGCHFGLGLFKALD